MDKNLGTDKYPVNGNMVARLIPMTTRPYHHGQLRATLLAEAERALREDGVESLSLRELARRVGVSHAAPRHHFPDRQALLDALAEAGSLRLADEVRGAVAGAGEDYREQLRAAAAAYLRFAVHDAALLDLMFASKADGGTAGLGEGFGRLFATVGDLIEAGRRAGLLPPDDPDRLRLLLIATVQGIAALVSSGRVPPEQTDALVAGAAALFTVERA